jgi:hypothetical protein
MVPETEYSAKTGKIATAGHNLSWNRNADPPDIGCPTEAGERKGPQRTAAPTSVICAMAYYFVRRPA